MSGKSASAPANKRKRHAARNRGPSTTSKARASTKALRAARDHTRRLEPGAKRDRRKRQLGLEAAAQVSGLETVASMGRTLSAFVVLPMRLARCRTPFDVWIEQTMFLRHVANEVQRAGIRMMQVAFVPGGPPGR